MKAQCNGQSGSYEEVDLSIIAPAHDEEENITGLVQDVRSALALSGLSFELLLVDDGSGDSTLARMTDQGRWFSWIRVLRLAGEQDGPHAGKSAALFAGIEHANGRWIAFIDADRQNDPDDLPKMLKLLVLSGSDLVQGDRSAGRHDHWIRRVSSWIGWVFCRAILQSPVRDAGCGFAVMTREAALRLPLQFSGMHRFTAFYADMLGFKVKNVPVRHRPRIAGRAKYGVWNRALPGLLDLFAVAWMRRRFHVGQCELHEMAEDQETARCAMESRQETTRY